MMDDKYIARAKTLLRRFTVDAGGVQVLETPFVIAIAHTLREAEDTEERACDAYYEKEAELARCEGALQAENKKVEILEKMVRLYTQERDEAREKLVVVGQEFLEERARAVKAEMELSVARSGTRNPPPDASRIATLEAENERLRGSLVEVRDIVTSYTSRMREIIEKEKVQDD